MNVRETLGQAMTTGDLPRVKRIVDRLRTHGLGLCDPFNYADLLAFAQRAVPGITKQAWETMLEQIDNLEVE